MSCSRGPQLAGMGIPPPGAPSMPASLHDFSLTRTSIHRKHGDPFPLPRLREGLRAEAAETSLHRRADEAFKCLNELAAVPFDETVRTSTASLTKVQEWIVKDVLRRISQHGHAPDLTEQAALDEIVSSEHLYEQEANHLVGLDISRIKVLQRQARPSLTVDLASPEAKAYLLNYRELIERPAFELEADGFQESLPTPYWDPLLRRSQRRGWSCIKLFSGVLCFLSEGGRRPERHSSLFAKRTITISGSL